MCKLISNLSQRKDTMSRWGIFNAIMGYLKTMFNPTSIKDTQPSFREFPIGICKNIGNLSNWGKEKLITLQTINKHERERASELSSKGFHFLEIAIGKRKA